MNKGFYAKLAADNIKKNSGTYVPFMLTCTVTIAMFYIICSLSQNDGIQEMRGATYISVFMAIGSVLIAVFSVIFLFYTNSFLIKRRKKEFGLLNVLGMEKRHISAVIALETLYTAIICLAAGLVFGILLDKLMYLLIANLLDADITLGFYISVSSIIISLILFGTIFFFMFVFSVGRIHFSNPLQLLKGGSAGEREPKTKWLMAFLGFICLGLGYYISITIQDMSAAFMLFFAAVFLVVAGTYMLFTAGSIFILKALRKNKRYYYKTKHFISISGMIYRMKQNAVGLANICILSTMVLVMISSTSCLMIGMEDILNSGYPYDLSLVARRPYYGERAEEKLNAFDEAYSITAEYEKEITLSNVFNVLEIICYFDGNSASFKGEKSLNCIYFITIEDYNKTFGTNISLGDGEIMAAPRDPRNPAFQYDSVELFGEKFKIKEKREYFYAANQQDSVMGEISVVALPSLDVMTEISNMYCEAFDIVERGLRCHRIMNVNFNCEKERQTEIISDIRSRASREFIYLESKAEGRYDFLNLYGGLFFLGVFLGTLFIMAAILIIYYKQISEGYDDRKRFEIMQNVGLSRSEVRASIHSQVLSVFFLPLIAAGIHMAAAFPIVAKLLQGMMMFNTGLFILCTVCSFLAFALMYVIVYLLTARSYYRIVSTKD